MPFRVHLHDAALLVLALEGDPLLEHAPPQRAPLPRPPRLAVLPPVVVRCVGRRGGKGGRYAGSGEREAGSEERGAESEERGAESEEGRA